MKRNLFALAALALALSACSSAKNETQALRDRLSEAETVAEHSDVVVLVTGLNENLEGEEMDQSNSVGSGDKANLLLPAVKPLYHNRQSTFISTPPFMHLAVMRSRFRRPCR